MKTVDRHRRSPAIALGFVFSMAVAADGPKPVAYVSNQEGGVTVIDLERMEKVREIDVGGRGPRGIGITDDGGLLVTANKDTADVSIIDTRSYRVLHRIPIGKNPEFARVYGKRAHVTYEPGVEDGPSAPGQKVIGPPAAIAVIDLARGVVAQTLPSGQEAEGTEFSPDGKRMLVANEGDNTIAVYDTGSGERTETIRIESHGERPRGIKRSPDGRYYAVALEFSAKLLLLDPDLQAIKTVPTGASPYGMAFDRDGKRLFVVAARAKALEALEAKTFAKIAAVPIGERCWHFTFTPDYNRILVACGRSHEIRVIDAERYTTLEILGGFKLPWGVVTFPKASGSLDAP
ncbi:MAG: beta-propeller fold lactonase family protein [Gammaproteobacteria bacterium]